jgi:cyclic pyranopterin phosphate synthase
MTTSSFTHLDSAGKLHMVDVGGKAATTRRAVAAGFLQLPPDVLALLIQEKGKGDAFGSSRVAGIMAAKRTSDLLPLTHPLKIDRIALTLAPWQADKIAVFCDVAATDRTGVEMEAMVGASVALLNLYDMTKAVTKAARLREVRLLFKSGGKSGIWMGEGIATGQVEKLAVSKSKGVPKDPCDRAILRENHGLESDAHAGDWHRQVSLLGVESIAKMKQQGLKVDFGSFAENVAVSGLCLYELPIGSLLFSSRGVLLEVTQIGKECHTKCAVYQKAGDCVMPREGIFARVSSGGELAAGDSLLALSFNS